GKIQPEESWIEKLRIGGKRLGECSPYQDRLSGVDPVYKEDEYTAKKRRDENEDGHRDHPLRVLDVIHAGLYINGVENPRED
ncbi:unnamed protein product, partial [marine sediment metagenome]